MNEQQVKIIERAIKSANDLHRSFEDLEFESAKFNKIFKKIASFKTTSMIAMAATGLVAGSIISSYLVQNFQQIKYEELETLKKYKIEIIDNADKVQIYTLKNEHTKIWQDDRFVVLEINKKDKK